MAPDDPAEEGDRDHREGHGAVAEDGLARKDRQDLRGNAHRRQDQDVDFRMTEEPEQVLPQDRLAAFGGIEEGGPEAAIEEQHRHRGGEHREAPSSSRIAVMKSDQMTRGMRKNVIPGARMLMTVVM